MATRLYLRDLPWTGANNPPRLVETAANDAVAVGALTPRALSLEPGASQKAIAIATKATTARQTRIYATFVSEPLANAETFTQSNSGTFAISVADSETNLNVNHSANLAAVFVFRPSTNTVLGRLHFNDQIDALEPSSASSIQTSYTSRTIYPINGGPSEVLYALPGDVIVCQIGASFIQGMGTAYSASFYYDGAVVNTAENAVVSNHASFIEFSRNLAFLYLGAVDGSASGASSASGTLTDLPGQLPAGGALCSASASATGMGNSDAPLGRLYCRSRASGGLSTLSALQITATTVGYDGPYIEAHSNGLETVFASKFAGSYYSLHVSANGGAWFDLMQLALSPSTTLNGIAVDTNNGVAVVQVTGNRDRLTAPYTGSYTYENLSDGYYGRYITFMDGQFLALREGSINSYIQYSADGSAWSSSPTLSSPYNVLKLGAVYVCGGVNAIRKWQVGGSWTAVSVPPGLSTAQWRSAALLGGVAYLMDSLSRSIISSPDGTNWTLRGVAPAGATKIHAVGTTFLVATTATEIYHISRDGGASWESRGGGSAVMVPLTDGMLSMAGTTTRRIAFSAATFPPYPLGGDLYSSVTAEGLLGEAGAYSPILLPAPMLVASSASADLLTAKGTKLYPDGPLTVVTSTTANLTEGPTQWLGVAKARSRTGGIAPVFGAYPSSDNGDVQHYTVLPNGRWLCSKDFTLRYSDDEGRVWRDTGVVSGYYASVALNAAGTRAVLPGAYSALYSDDFGKTWQAGTGSSGEPTSRVVYGAGKFVRFVDLGLPSPGATAEGRAQYSPDGVNWTNGPIFTDSVVPSLRSGLRASAGENLWYDATLGKFIALARISYIDYPAPLAYTLMLSSDGINWTIRGDAALLGYLGLDYLGCAVRNGVMTTGQHYSTDAGLTWNPCSGISNAGVNPDYVVIPTATGFAAFVCGRAADGPASSPETRAFVSSDGQTWDSRPIGGLPVAPGFLRGMSVPISGRPGEHFVLVRPQYMAGLTPREGTTMLTVESGPTLTATGKQAATLMGAMADAVRAYGNIRDRVTPQFQGALLAQSTTQPAALLNADPYRVLLRNTAQASAALTTKVILRGTAKARSVQPPRGLTLSENRYLPGQVARSPNGTVITATHRLDPTTRVWAPLSPPDGTNLPMRVCHDGTNFIAFIAAGAKTYTSADGKTWVAGTPVTLPSGADWVNLTQLSLSGAEGKSVMTACIGNSFVAWTSINGRTWTAGTRPTTIGGDMRLGPLGYRNGYYFAVYATISGSGYFCYSVNGTSWARSVFYPGALNLAEPALSYSGGVLSVSRRMPSNADVTWFYSMDDLMAGAVDGLMYPNAIGDVFGVPSVYYVGDPLAEEPTFYVASPGALGQLINPHRQTSIQYTAVYNAPPAGVEFTGDFVVLDEYYFGRTTRTADSVDLGAVSRIGPDLLNITNALTASIKVQASATTIFFTAAVALDGAMSAVSAASASLTTRQPLSGTLQAVASTNTPVLRQPVALAGSLAASGTVGGSLTTSIRLSAPLVASATAAADLLVPKPLAGAALGAASATANLQVPARFTAEVTAEATAQAALKTGISLTGAIESLATSAGAISVGAIFYGSSFGGSMASGDLSTEILLGADVAAQCDAQAQTLITEVLLAAELTCEVLAEAELDTQITLMSVVSAVVSAQGQLRNALKKGDLVAQIRHTEGQAPMIARPMVPKAWHRTAPDTMTAMVYEDDWTHTDSADSMLHTAPSDTLIHTI